MKSIHIARGFWILCASFLVGCEEANETAQGPVIGIQRLAFEDANRMSWSNDRQRPLVTMVWYPAVDGLIMTEIGIPPDKPVFVGGMAARNGAVKTDAYPYPLVIMSHGTGGSGLQMMWLGRALAERGYIAAAVNHHGNTAAEEKYDSRGFRMPWERAEDLRRVIDLLLADEKFGPVIDTNNISAVGYSLGGYTVTALSGAQTNIDLLDTFCASTNRDATCGDQSEFPEATAEFKRLLESDPVTRDYLERSKLNFKDERVTRIVALAPAIVHAFDEESLGKVDVPFLVIVGEVDMIAPSQTNAVYLSKKLPETTLVTIPDAGHYVFLNKCNKRGKRFVPICKDPEEVDRREVHSQVIERITAFLQ